MKKQITFQNRNFPQDRNALEWLFNLSKCFFIKKAKLRSYKKKFKWEEYHCTRIEVEYE